MLMQGEKTPSERVADVLKSSLERHLVTTVDAVRVAGHGSHVVSDIFRAGTRDEGALNVAWNDEKFKTFVERLSVLQDAEAV